MDRPDSDILKGMLCVQSAEAPPVWAIPTVTPINLFSAKGFARFIPLESYKIPLKKVLFLFPFYIRKEWRLREVEEVVHGHD